MRRTSWVMRQALAIVGSWLMLELFMPGMTPSTLAESFNIKPGAWEMTTTMTTSGSKVSPEKSAKLTPAQRAQMEQMMKAREGKPMTVTDRSCITKEDLSHDHIIKEMEDADEDEEMKCTIKVISKSSSKLVIHRICPAPRSSTTHWTIEAKSTESFVGSGERGQPGLGKGLIEVKGKWLGASCEGIED